MTGYYSLHAIVLHKTATNMCAISTTVGQEIFVVLNFRGLLKSVIFVEQFLWFRHRSPYNLYRNYKIFMDKTPMKSMKICIP